MITDAALEACSGFTRITARRIARPPEAAFVTRLRPAWSPGQAARQPPEQPTTLRVEPYLHWWRAPSGCTERSRPSDLVRANGGHDERARRRAIGPGTGWGE